MANEKIKNAAFHHVALRAADYDKTVEFYTEALGMKLVRSWGEGDSRVCMLDIGDGGCFEIFARGSAAAEPDGEYFHFAIATTDVDAAFEAAVAGGAAVDKAPYDTVIPCHQGDLPVRIAFVKGLNGETLEFFCVK